MYKFILSHFIIFADIQYSVIDINECQREPSPCDQKCTNTVGSYTCKCKPGYQLNANKRSCDGKLQTLVVLPLFNIFYVFKHLYYLSCSPDLMFFQI